MSLFTDTQMADLPPLEQAKKAIRHALMQIKDNPKVAYHLGVGTQTFALLTEAFATIFERPVEEVRHGFAAKGEK